jgi:hypothetical protein
MHVCMYVYIHINNYTYITHKHTYIYLHVCIKNIHINLAIQDEELLHPFAGRLAPCQGKTWPTNVGKPMP